VQRKRRAARESPDVPAVARRCRTAAHQTEGAALIGSSPIDSPANGVHLLSPDRSARLRHEPSGYRPNARGRRGRHSLAIAERAGHRIGLFHEPRNPSASVISTCSSIVAVRDVGWSGPMRPDHGRMIWDGSAVARLADNTIRALGAHICTTLGWLIGTRGDEQRRMRYRWTICALLFAHRLLNYSIARCRRARLPTPSGTALDRSQSTRLVSWFSLPDAIAFAFAGLCLTRRCPGGLGTAVIAWTSRHRPPVRVHHGGILRGPGGARTHRCGQLFRVDQD